MVLRLADGGATMAATMAAALPRDGVCCNSHGERVLCTVACTRQSAGLSACGFRDETAVRVADAQYSRKWRVIKIARLSCAKENPCKKWLGVPDLYSAYLRFPERTEAS